MKKTRLAIILVAFCIILSFFSSVYAVETTQFTIDDDSILNCYERDGKVSIEANVTFKGNEKITFVPKYTGVYDINVEGITREPGKDLYYKISNHYGYFLRLAAYYDEETGQYKIFSSENDTQTDVSVLLIAGQEYNIGIIHKDQKGGPDYGFLSSFVSPSKPSHNYKATIQPNKSEHNVIGNVYQSNRSSGIITSMFDEYDFLKTYTEQAVDPYKMPDGTKTKFDGKNDAEKLVDTVAEYTVNTLEEIICELLLALGDFLVSIMNQIMGEDVTITKLVYNQIDSVNANFFDGNVVAGGVTASIKDVVCNWYNLFKMIAIAIYLMVLLAIGLHILLASTGDGMAKAKDLLTQWLKGIASLILIPYLIKYAFMLNEALVDMLRETASVPKYEIGSGFTAAGDWSLEEVEFRSPAYVSKYTGSVAFGSDEATETYMKKLETYEQNLDLMRIMRAYAGITKKMIYVIIWYILIGQLIVMIIQYYKRYFIIGFLIAMFPLVCIFHGISVAQGSSKGEMGSWVKEILTNIFIQFVHAIVYTVITGICVAVVKEDLQSSAALNWIMIILAINFISEGEKLLRKIIGAMGSTAEGAGQTGKGIKAAYNKAKSGIKKASGND